MSKISHTILTAFNQGLDILIVGQQRPKMLDLTRALLNTTETSCILATEDKPQSITNISMEGCGFETCITIEEFKAWLKAQPGVQFVAPLLCSHISRRPFQKLLNRYYPHGGYLLVHYTRRQGEPIVTTFRASEERVGPKQTSMTFSETLRRKQQPHLTEVRSGLMLASELREADALPPLPDIPEALPWQDIEDNRSEGDLFGWEIQDDDGE